MTFIRSIGIHHGETILDIENLPEREFLEPEERAELESLGIRTVRDCGGVPCVELARLAGMIALREAEIEPDELDSVIYLSPRVPDSLISSEAAHFQSMLGAERAWSLGLSDLGCATISGALVIADSLMRADARLRNIMIAHGNRPPGRNRYRPGVTIQGDGGVAVVLSRSGAWKVENQALETSGKYWDLYSMQYRDKAESEWREVCKDRNIQSFELAVETGMRMKSILRRMFSGTPEVTESAMRLLVPNLSAASFDFHEKYSRMTVLPECRRNLSAYGHLGSMDLFLNLNCLKDMKDGDCAVLLNVSPTAAWSGLRLRYFSETHGQS